MERLFSLKGDSVEILALSLAYLTLILGTITSSTGRFSSLSYKLNEFFSKAWGSKSLEFPGHLIQKASWAKWLQFGALPLPNKKLINLKEPKRKKSMCIFFRSSSGFSLRERSAFVFFKFPIEFIHYLGLSFLNKHNQCLIREHIQQMVGFAVHTQSSG